MRLFEMVLLAGVFLVMSGCTRPLLLDGKATPAKYSAPTGAYFVKPGMTREERLRDLAACGTHCGPSICFTKEQMEKATIPEDKAAPGEITDGALILLRQLRACMASRGYYGLPLDACTGNDPKVLEPCMYP